MARGTWRLPGYRIESLIGAGSSGEVWRATVTSTGVPVALKRIWLSERAQRDTALGEAAMLSTLDHAHLMKLHEVRSADDSIVLVLDLAAAGSLADLLARRGRLTPGEVVTSLAPIGSALAYAHTRGVVHGDVSAANILFTDIGLPLLADLGVARLLDEKRPARTTPSYVEPAVARGGAPMSDNDVFMLGGVALHALTGSPPWPGSDSAEVLALAAGTIESPDFAARLAAAAVPPGVAKVVVRALEVDASHRSTAAEFALELRHAATPVAVELTAGRARHAVDPLQSWPLESAAPDRGGGGSGDGAVPAGGPPFARLPLTDGVRAPVPFTRPPGARHQARRARWRRALLSAAVLLVVSAGVLVFWPPSTAPPRKPALAATAAPRSQASRAVPGTGPSTGVRTASSAARTVLSAARTASSAARTVPRTEPGVAIRPWVVDVLARLDATRSRAFAARDPTLLAQVYASPLLLARDRATLLSAVPRGCRLAGVHSTFRHLRAVRDGASVRVHARVAVRAGRLVCDGSPAGRATPARAVPMTIVLRRSGPDLQIASERVSR